MPGAAQKLALSAFYDTMVRAFVKKLIGMSQHPAARHPETM
jgi:hypothetical protein